VRNKGIHAQFIRTKEAFTTAWLERNGRTGPDKICDGNHTAKGKFKPFVEGAGMIASLHDRRASDFAVAFGCETCEEEDNDRI
jgi:hypothetical protein